MGYQFLPTSVGPRLSFETLLDLITLQPTIGYYEIISTNSDMREKLNSHVISVPEFSK